MRKPLNFQLIKGLVTDIDGTLILHGKPIAGAIEAINTLRKRGIKLRFITNTTGRSPSQLADMLISLGFDVEAHEILTSVTACADHLKANFSNKGGYFAVPDNTAQILENLGIHVSNDEESAEYIVIGDLKESFDYPLLNRLFNYVYQGAHIIAFHRNPFFFEEQKVWLDSGAFTRVFENIANVKATITGKPSPALFESAIASMALLPEQVCVVGDDVQSDILGANKAGLRSILVETGKFEAVHLGEAFPQADAYTSSFAELPRLLINQIPS